MPRAGELEPSLGAVFISYARADLAIVDRLVAALEHQDVPVWIDRRSIAPGASWDDELATAIDGSLAVVSVVTDASLASEMCARELQRAVEGDKIVVPVRTGPTARTLPSPLQERQWLDLLDAEAAEPVAHQLAALVRSDVEWLREHAFVLAGARRWESDPRRSRLLRGLDLDAAVAAFEAGSTRTKPPRPTPLQLEYIEASRAAALDPMGGSLVGRADEIARVERAVSEARLVSIIGPGGVGKTRLASEVALRAERSLGGNVYFVDLSPLRDAGLVLPTVAAAFELAQSDRDELLRSIADQVGLTTTLLVLDNFEHVLGARMDVAELIDSSRSLRMLVTSRERLDLSDERPVSLAPLSTADAVELLRQRATELAPGTALSDETARRICDLVDRLPLAIELATARLDLMSPDQLADALGEGRASLRGPADADARQSTLEGLVAWSYELLDDDERAAFEDFSVFRGGGTLDTARAVGGLDVDLIGSLVRKSLLTRTDDSGPPRFRMLETIRSFAEDQLPFERRDLLVRNLAHHLVHDAPGVAESLERIDWIDREIDNLRAVLAWAFDAPSIEPFTFLLVDRSMAVWIDRGRLIEGRWWSDRLMERVQELPAPARSEALGWAGEVALYGGDIDRAVERKRLAVEYARTHDSEDLTADLVDLGRALSLAEDPDAALPLLEEALEARMRAGHPEGISHAMAALASVRSSSDPPGAIAMYEAALDRLHESTPVATGWAQIQELEERTELALVRLRQGDVVESLDVLHRALALDVTDRTMFLAITVEALAASASRCGDEGVARELAALAGLLRERTGLGLTVLGSSDLRRTIEAGAGTDEMERLRADIRSRELADLVGELPLLAASLRERCSG